MTTTDARWQQLLDHTAEIARLKSAIALLEWDEQVTMPSAGAAARSRQTSLLSTLIHERTTDARFVDLVNELAQTALPPERAAAIRRLQHTTSRAVRVPSSLVAAQSEAYSEGFHAWIGAKRDDDFASFAPKLERVFELKRQEAAAIDADDHPYDVLLQDFEPGTRLAQLHDTFSRLEDGTRELLDAVRGAPAPDPLKGRYDLAGQKALHEELIAHLGYDMDAGRLDFSEHPFTVGVAPGDVRLTTHLYDDDLLMGLGGTIHECGHGLYEQGLPHALPGTGVDEAASYGLHESQSRFWENTIGNSLPFMRWLAPRIRAHVGVDLDPEALYRAANPVRASLIRIFADEVTYNLHIIARFQLEVAMLTGELAVSDLPGAWNDTYDRVLGIRPPSDREGCLQDVHWATGAIAYFPTYTLGNLFAASLGAAMTAELPDLWQRVEAGDFAPILGWLRDRIHRRGHEVDAPEIVHDAAGPRDGVADLLDHLWGRHGALYGVSRG